MKNDKKPNAWTYQKGRYKQVSIKFFCESDIDMRMYDYLRSLPNMSRTLKSYIISDMIKAGGGGDGKINTKND